MPLPPGTPGPAGLPDDEFGFEHRLLVPVVGAGRLLQQQLGRAPAQFVPRLAHRASAARRRPRRSRCRRSRRSPGRRAPATPWRTISCSTPSASRSFAQKHGGRTAARRQPDDLLGGLAAAGDGQLRGGQDGQRVVGPAALPHGGAHAVVPLLHLGKARTSRRRRRSAGARARARGRRPAARRGRRPPRPSTGRGGRPPVDQDQRYPAAADRVQGGGELGGRGDQDALHPLLGEQVEVAGLPAGVVALLQRITASPCSLATSSTARARSVKNGLAMSSTTSPMVRLEPARSWRADSLRTKPSWSMAAWTRPGGAAHRVGPVEHVADRADRDARPPGDVPDAAVQREAPRSRRCTWVRAQSCQPARRRRQGHETFHPSAPAVPGG